MNFCFSKLWKPKELHFVVCEVTLTRKLQHRNHFKSLNHNNRAWNCTRSANASAVFIRGFQMGNFGKLRFCLGDTNQI